MIHPRALLIDVRHALAGWRLRGALMVLGVGLGSWAPTPGLMAQDDAPVKISELQRGLNDAAVDAAIRGDYVEAVKLLEASLGQGDLNVTYLNLGRAYAKNGQCREALGAFDKVMTAPRVESPPHDMVLSVMLKYKQELSSECEGLLVVQCLEPRTEIIVDDGEPIACHEASFWLTPGSHRMVARLNEQRDERAVEIKGLQTEVVRFELEGADIEPPPPPPPPLTTKEHLAWWGWGTASAGGVLLLVSVGMEYGVLQPDIEAYREAASRGHRVRYDELAQSISSTQQTNIALFSVGAGLVLIGGALVIASYAIETPALSAEEAPAASWRDLGAWGSEEGGGVTWRAVW